MRAVEELAKQARREARTAAQKRPSLADLKDVELVAVQEETIVPMVVSNPGPLPPIDELALEPGETIVPEDQTPAQVLGSTLAGGPEPSAERVAVDRIIAVPPPPSAVERPQDVIVTRKSYWWQFWKRDGNTARLR
jgi:hypothetical protein